MTSRAPTSAPPESAPAARPAASSGMARTAPAYGVDFVDRGPRAGGSGASRLPPRLQAGIEALSGIDMSDVRVHANSPRPAEVRASALTEGSEIHLGSGEERYLPHEAWHVVQQKQGRVRATFQAKGAPANDDPALEQEADVMGARAARAAPSGLAPASAGGAMPKTLTQTTSAPAVIQMGNSQNPRSVPSFVKEYLSVHHLEPEFASAGDIATWIEDVHDAQVGVGEIRVVLMELSAPRPQPRRQESTYIGPSFDDVATGTSSGSGAIVVLDDDDVGYGNSSDEVRSDDGGMYDPLVDQQQLGSQDQDSASESSSGDPPIVGTAASFLSALAALSESKTAEVDWSFVLHDLDTGLNAKLNRDIRTWLEKSGIQVSFISVATLLDWNGMQATGVYGSWSSASGGLAPALERVLYGCLWTVLRTEFASDVYNPQSPLLKPLGAVCGVRLFVTKRLGLSDCSSVIGCIQAFQADIAKVDIELTAVKLFEQQANVKARALDVWKVGTGSKQAVEETALAHASKPVALDTLILYLTRARAALLAALSSGKICLVIDRAQIETVSGGASSANALKPMSMMAEQGIALTEDEIVRVNLDAGGFEALKVTLAHEVAHIAGFNPSGHGASGHMEDVAHYLLDEPGVGLSKLLVDAYFFEIVYQLLMRS